MKRKFAILLAAMLPASLLLTAQVPYKAGDMASDFKLKNVKGETISLADIPDARGFIVTFWCNTCPVVKKYESRLIELHKEFSDKGYPVIAINSNDRQVSPGDSYAEMQKKAMNMGYKFEYLYDESQDVARTYGATNTPQVYLLTKNKGMLLVQYVGAIDNNSEDASAADRQYVRDALNSLLKGEQVAVKGTRAIGCSLKWKKVSGGISLYQPGQKINYYRMTGSKEAC